MQDIERLVKKTNPSSIQKMLFTLLFCFVIATIGGYVSWLLGADYFVIDIQQEVTRDIVSQLVCKVLFLLNMLFMIMFCIKSTAKRYLLSTIAYTPILFFSSHFFEGTLISTVVFPLCYTVILFFVLSEEKRLPQIGRFIVMLLIFNIAVVLYQIPTTAIKLNVIDLYSHVAYIGLQTKIMTSIDVLLWYALLVVIGGEASNGLESLVYSESIESVKLDHEDLSEINTFNKLSLHKKAKALILLGMFQLIQMFLVLGVCYIGNVLIEAAFIMFAYLSSIVVIKRRWHSNSILVCTLTTITIFYAASRTVIPVKYSMFIPLIIGMLISYSLYLVAVKSDELEWLRALAYFDVNSCTKEQLIERCKIVGVKEKDFDFCVAMFIDKMKAEQAADTFFIEVQSVKNKKGRLARKLNRPK